MNAEKNESISGKNVGECTIEELLDYVSSHVPAFAAGVCIPDDGGDVITMTFTCGNRPTQVGLARLVEKRAMRTLMANVVADNTDDNSDDEETG